MTSKSRTIDNLGLDASVRYAQDQKLFEAHFIEDSQMVARRSETPVFKPYAPSDFDLIFGATKLSLKVCELPIRYWSRQYGTTQIQRFRHGLLLFRMCFFAMKKIKFIY